MADLNSVGIVETQFYTFAETPEEALVLESGTKLGPVTLAYETYGTLNEGRNNAILIAHALSGDAHVAGRHSADDTKSGWWDNMVGPGKAFDTNKYFVICSNVLGGCQGSTGPASINPETGKHWGIKFPVITIGDMVRAQRELIRGLGVERLLTVAGGSMGGMQALEWAIQFPDFLDSVMVIASTHYSGAQQIAFDAVGRNAILLDEAFNSGQYYEGDQPSKGLSIARMLAHITYLSEDSMRDKFGRTLRSRDQFGYDFDSEFAVETYLDYQGQQFVNRFDANSYLYVTKAMDYFDLSAKYEALDDVMVNVKCKVLVLSFTSDWLYPPYQSKEIVYALTRQRKDVTYLNVQSDYGHDAFLLEDEVMGKVLSGFLAHTADPDKRRTDALKEDSELEVGPPALSTESIYEGHRVDYDMIVNLVDEGARVLDLGCGGGELMQQLIVKKNVEGIGIEKSQGNVVTCTRRGISVVQADIDNGLTRFPDDSFDFVILSMTLQVLKKPELALKEMLRVGKKCIVSFPNFGFWRVRSMAFFQGRAPVTRNLPYAWYQTPNRHVLSMDDFRKFCVEHEYAIEKEIPLWGESVAKFWPNLLAEEALYVITK